MNTFKVLLTCGGLLSFAASIFQAALAFSPAWSAAFDAPNELVANPPLLLAAGLVVSILLAIFGLYGLSGAGIMQRLPLLRLGLLGIGLAYALPGLNLVPQLLVITGAVSAPQPIPPLILLRNIVISSGALLTSLLYLAGLVFGWKYLSAGRGAGVQSRKAIQTDPGVKA